MNYAPKSIEPAAFPINAATVYSGFTRTYLYENRHRLDWIKAGRRSLITRASLDRLLLELLEKTNATAGTPPTRCDQSKPSSSGGAP
jgi:hypothetical protein